MRSPAINLLLSLLAFGLGISSPVAQPKSPVDQPSPTLPTGADTSTATVAEGELDDDELPEPPPPMEEEVILDPMEMRFRINKIERGLSRNARVFEAPRIVTLSVLGAVGVLEESAWRDRRLGVFHKVPIELGNGMISFNRVKVGEVKVKSVSQSTIQAEVISDDLTRSLSKRKRRLSNGEARVVMIGDTARLERAIIAPKKRKVRRVYKPKKKNQYERKEMKWRL